MLSANSASVSHPQAGVLIVDDQKELLWALKYELEAEGHHVECAQSGEEALRLASSQSFAVILLDLHMPGLDGLETARRLKALEHTRYTPIVFLTGDLDSVPRAVLAYRTGAVDFLTKPFDSEILCSKVSVFVELQRRGLQLREEAEARAREQAAREQAEELLAVTAALAEAVTSADVASVIVEHAMGTLGADVGLVYVAPSGSAELELVGHRNLPEQEQGRLRRLSLDARSPCALVYRDGQARFASSRGEYEAASFDPRSDGLREAGVEAFACVPLVVRGGRTIGSLLVAFTHERALSETERALLQGLGAQCAQSLERAWLFDAEREAKRVAEEASRLKDEFLATVSHELRTPLTPIVGWAELLLGPMASDPRVLHQGLEVIERNALAQKRLVEDLLDVSRIIHRRLSLELTDVDLAAVAAEAVDMVRGAASEKGLTIATRFAAGVHKVVGDAGRLRQVVSNLLTNAIKFTPRGGQIEVGIGRAQGTLKLWVADTGCGIPSAFVPHLFEPFQQAEPSTSQVRGGLGLGLSIVRHIAELHGGSVSVETEQGAGATFTVVLPIGGARAAGAGKAAPAGLAHGPPPSRSSRPTNGSRDARPH